jgi:hypothetical protein
MQMEKKKLPHIEAAERRGWRVPKTQSLRDRAQDAQERFESQRAGIEPLSLRARQRR